MKRLSLIVFAFALLPGLTLLEKQPTSQVTLNGKIFAGAIILQDGMAVIPVQDFARAAGAPITLEPVFQIQGNRLLARGMSSGGDYKEQQKITTANAAAIKGESYKHAPGQIIAVRKAGVISNNVMMVGGKAYIPLADVVRAFGDGSVRGFTGGLKPGTAINLTSTNSAQGILVGL